MTRSLYLGPYLMMNASNQPQQWLAIELKSNETWSCYTKDYAIPTSLWLENNAPDMPPLYVIDVTQQCVMCFQLTQNHLYQITLQDCTSEYPVFAISEIKRAHEQLASVLINEKIENIIRQITVDEFPQIDQEKIDDYDTKLPILPSPCDTSIKQEQDQNQNIIDLDDVSELLKKIKHIQATTDKPLSMTTENDIFYVWPEKNIKGKVWNFFIQHETRKFTGILHPSEDASFIQYIGDIIPQAIRIDLDDDKNIKRLSRIYLRSTISPALKSKFSHYIKPTIVYPAFSADLLSLSECEVFQPIVAPEIKDLSTVPLSQLIQLENQMSELFPYPHSMAASHRMQHMLLQLAEKQQDNNMDSNQEVLFEYIMRYRQNILKLICHHLCALTQKAFSVEFAHAINSAHSPSLLLMLQFLITIKNMMPAQNVFCKNMYTLIERHARDNFHPFINLDACASLLTMYCHDQDWEKSLFFFCRHTEKLLPLLLFFQEKKLFQHVVESQQLNNIINTPNLDALSQIYMIFYQNQLFEGHIANPFIIHDIHFLSQTMSILNEYPCLPAQDKKKYLTTLTSQSNLKKLDQNKGIKKVLDLLLFLREKNIPLTNTTFFDQIMIEKNCNALLTKLNELEQQKILDESNARFIFKTIINNISWEDAANSILYIAQLFRQHGIEDHQLFIDYVRCIKNDHASILDTLDFLIQMELSPEQFHLYSRKILSQNPTSQKILNRTKSCSLLHGEKILSHENSEKILTWIVQQDNPIPFSEAILILKNNHAIQFIELIANCQVPRIAAELIVAIEKRRKPQKKYQEEHLKQQYHTILQNIMDWSSALKAIHIIAECTHLSNHITESMLSSIIVHTHPVQIARIIQQFDEITAKHSDQSSLAIIKADTPEHCNLEILEKIIAHQQVSSLFYIFQTIENSKFSMTKNCKFMTQILDHKHPSELKEILQMLTNLDILQCLDSDSMLDLFHYHDLTGLAKALNVLEKSGFLSVDAESTGILNALLSSPEPEITAQKMMTRTSTANFLPKIVSQEPSQKQQTSSSTLSPSASQVRRFSLFPTSNLPALPQIPGFSHRSKSSLN